MASAAYYPVNDTSRSLAERAYLQELTDFAAEQPLEEDSREQVRTLTIVFTVIAVCVVGLRFVSRQKIKAPFWVDDWLILAALVLLFGNAAFNFVMVDQGVGLHSGRLTLPELQALNKTIVGAEIIYLTGVNAYKISLLFLYYRIFPIKSVRTWSYVFGGLSTCWNIAGVFAAAFQCTPRVKIWEPWVDGYCINIFLVQLLVSVPSILCDIAILCLPLPHVLRLKTNLTQKVFLVIMFMLGSYVVFTSIYRFTVYLGYSPRDIPYTLAVPVAWNVIEISSGIVSSCLPTLGPIIRPVIKSVMPSSAGLSGNKDSTRRGYERNQGAGSRSGLVTIGGGGARKSSGHWSRLGGSARREPEDVNDFDVDGDIEMQPRGEITGIVVTNHDLDEKSKGNSASRASTTQLHVTVGNESDESLLAAHGITRTQTIEVQWTTQQVSEPSPVVMK
ncbi:hypothetical protein KVR01_012910 [Diaporthe batatas]|uniref:uncharacterized protein n=1 Tax=Diaporthe batatas TaxID=748121 RepID=UPI001D045549|nr:uncharacterized protein KVR01_012910 [Diaporthe batatas]KAG8157202.1 hypothetical protein KVR01_012910 [Diaporthe batatas]